VIGWWRGQRGLECILDDVGMHDMGGGWICMKDGWEDGWGPLCADPG